MSTEQQTASASSKAAKTGIVHELRAEVGEPTVRGIVPALVVCGFIFAVIGAILIALFGGGYSASALVASPSVTAQFGTLNPTSDPSEVAQTELVYAGIAAPVMSEAVSQKLGISNPPPVKVSVEPGTTILQFQAKGSSAQQAADIANTSANAYVDWWRQRASASVQKQLTVANAQLAKDPSAGDLKKLQASLQLQLATIQAEPRIIEEASADTATNTTSLISGALLGGLVGVLVGIGVIGLARRRSKAVESDEQSN